MNNQLRSAQTILVKCIVVVGFAVATMYGANALANETRDGCSEAAGYPCTHDLELDAYPLSRVPTTFKFQARISQAKLPVGDVKFPKIIVLIKNGETTECREELTNVAVYDSVLNLEIGANMSCDMDEVIARYNNLGIDICIANDQNCLKRVKLSTVPYAIKASYAFEASKADKANHAVECHYAHRMAADANLFDAKSIGTGFYNFHTPTDLDLLMSGLFEGQSVPDKYYRGGYIQWAPVTNDDSNLHICKMHVDAVTDTPMTLEELFLHAKATHMTGVATVWGDQTSGTTDFTVKGDALVEENQRVMKNQNVDEQLAVGGHAVIGQGEQTIDYSTHADGLDVFGLGAFHDSVTVDGTTDVIGATTLRSTLNVTGETTLNNTLGVVGATTLSNTLDVTKGATFDDTLTTTGQTNANGGLVVQNGSTVTGNAVFNNNVSVNQGGLDVITGKSHLAGGLTVDADTLINDNVTIGTAATGNNRNMHVHHDTTFYGGVHFEPAEVTGLTEGLVLGSDNIGAGTINSEKIKNDSVASIDIADGTITAADLAPGTDTNAGNICSANQVLTGGGTCKSYQVDTNTNAASICNANYVLTGGGTCKSYQVDTNTNAATICPDDKFLRGDGVCTANPLQENAHIAQQLYADDGMTVSDNNGGSLVNFKTNKTDATYSHNNYYWGGTRTAYMLWRDKEYFQLHADQASKLLLTGGKVYINPYSSGRGVTPLADLHVNGSSYISGSLGFDSSTRQKINLMNDSNGIGTQSNTQYYRTSKNFAWYKGGAHNGTELNPGGGKTLMTLNDGALTVGTKVNIDGSMTITPTHSSYFGTSAYINMGDISVGQGMFVNGVSSTKTVSVWGNKGATLQGGSRSITMNPDSTKAMSTSTGAYLSTGGTWANGSDVNTKENFMEIDTSEILEKIAELPITEWNYIEEQDDVRHVGPMSQDFYAAFGLGGNNTSITTIDGQGIALAAIQGLNNKCEQNALEKKELEAKYEAQQVRLNELEEKYEAQQAQIQTLEKLYQAFARRNQK